MKILLINTCGAEASFALAEGDPPRTDIVQEVTMPGRTASERLVALLRQSFATAGWKVAEVNGIAVVTGPGSFTGVRVGLSVAKGLSEAHATPLLPISRLELLASQVAAASGGTSPKVCALLDAGRSQFYQGLYGPWDVQTASGPESLVSLDAALLDAALQDAIRADAVICCETAVHQVLSFTSALLVPEPSAAGALPLALKRYASRAFFDSATVDANYLRRSDAEIFAGPSSSRSR